MNVEFSAPDDEQKQAVATVSWDGRTVTVASDDVWLRDKLVHAFRKIQVAVDDPSLRRLGTSGPVLLQPGSLEWFRAVAGSRATEESGLAARFVPDAVVSGFDPAANYRSFGEQMELLDERAHP